MVFRFTPHIRFTTKLFYYLFGIIKYIVLFCNMKNIIFTFTIILLVSCNTKLSNDKLYKETDFFVESLETTYDSYGIGGLDEQKITEDGMYQITPIGRLINVKILDNVPSSDYEKLEKELEEHYKNDYRVHKVYICNAGTVMIDCRN